MTRVIIYTRCRMCKITEEKYLPDCSHCNEARNFFEERKINYEEVDVSRYHDILMSSKDISEGKLFPLIQINDEFVEGFNPKKLENLINKVNLKD
jgi:glutaredoxin